MDPIKIRGHHILCILAFSGKGYSNKFIQTLQAIQNLIIGTSESMAEINTGADVICQSCPYLKNLTCIKNGPDTNMEVTSFDLKVIHKLDLKPGCRINLGSLPLLVKEKLTINDLLELCSNCEWTKNVNCPQHILNFTPSST